MFIARVRVIAPVLALAVLAVPGCAGLPGGSADPPSAGLEETTLNVAVVPAVDSAGFFVALHEGLFRKEGLTVNYTPATSSDTVIDEQVAGKYDITGGNYVSYIQHEATDRQSLQIIAEGSVMQEGTQAIYTLPNSKIKTLSQLQGHVLGINAPGNINYLLAASVLRENGISLRSVAFTSQPIAFPQLAADLAAGKVAAAALPEPLQRVADVMYQFGLLARPFSIGQMLGG